MNLAMIYNKSTEIATLTDYNFKDQLEVAINIPKDVTKSSIIVSRFAMEKFDYNAIFPLVLEYSPFSKRIFQVIQKTTDDPDLFEIVLLDPIVGLMICVADGEIWDWNFEFVTHQ